MIEGPRRRLTDGCARAPSPLDGAWGHSHARVGPPPTTPCRRGWFVGVRSPAPTPPVLRPPLTRPPPQLFCAAKDDAFIKPSHSQAIFERYAGDKNIVSVDGDHNSTRPPFWHASAAIFLRSALRVPDDDAWALPARPGGGRGAGDDAPFFLSLEDSWAAADAAAGGTGGDLAAEFVDSAAAIEEELFARALAASLELAGGAPPAPAPSRLR